MEALGENVGGNQQNIAKVGWRKKRKQEKKNPSILNSKVTMVAREFMTNKNFTRRLYILYNRIYNIYYIMQII